MEDAGNRKAWQNILFFLTLIAILVSGVKNLVPTLLLTALLVVELIANFKKG